MDKTQRNIEPFLVYLDASKCPRQFKVIVPKEGTMKNLCDTLAKVGNVDTDANSLVVTDVYNHRFHKIYAGDDSLSHILDRDDIFVYEIPMENSSQLIVPIYFREKKLAETYAPSTLFGQPFLLAVPKQNFTFKFLYDKILQSILRYVPSPPSEQLFSIRIVNSYGNGSIQQLNHNDSSLRFKDNLYLALDWDASSKSAHYNVKLAEEFIKDHSFLCRATSKLDCPECSGYSKAMETAKNIRQDLEGTTEEVKQNIITKIEKLNGDLEKLTAPNLTEIKRLDEKFSKTIETLKMSKAEEIQTVIKAKEKEIKSIEERYSFLLENIEKDSEKKEECERKLYQDEKRSIESNTSMVKGEILKIINNLTETLEKLEKPNEPDSNVKKELECPVCLEEMKPPVRILQCASGHLICERCAGRLETDKCPTCKVAGIVGRATAVEKLARALYRIKE